ncbi:alanine racemase [Glaciecola petra]|uniref:Alanine racemase n=1 Tax=Glaciecola petra TaxID=3075602 RepID=A0ABU2ZT24_9ALTE|nr:alanine racemase [Aestuariibacter sp. P117]MDT0595406.1 alanine racemase [Aestuariibacter sp. P117]
MQATKLKDLHTPCLLIEQSKLKQNISYLSEHIGALGCVIRPHVKTHKSVDITQLIVDAGNTQGITVSTLKEAKHFFAAGYTDILYAVGIVPNKFAAVQSLMEQGCKITVILDSLELAKLLGEYADTQQVVFNVLIELDVDKHRAGVNPHSQTLLDIAYALHHQSYTQLQGVMTHAGGSYECFEKSSQLALARQERDLSLLAAERIRAEGIACKTVSIGSTPTAFAIDDLSGITEVRAGVYVLFDLVMSGLGVCKIDDIAISVMGSIIGFQKEKQMALCDAGWMAMSRDRGTAGHKIDQGYGLICDKNGALIANMLMTSANQEHGIISMRKANTQRGKSTDFPFALFSIGDLIRILPNHACATAAQYNHFYLVDGDKVIKTLPSISGW